MFKIVKWVLIFIAVFFVVGAYFMISYYRGISAPAAQTGQEKIFIVAKGESVGEIAANLSNAGLINSETYFKIYIWRNKKEKNLQAGEYILNPKMNIKEVVEVITGGKTLSKERTIKILEGWRIKDIDNYFRSENILTADDFIKLAESKIGDWGLAGSKPEFLNDTPLSATLEGYLFPDTYRIFRNASAEDIIQKMLDNFDSKFTEKMRTDLKSQGKTIYSIITMASLIEKEVRSKEDMAVVAGIFWGRIKNGQPLQSDAGLSYILDDKKISHSFDELAIDSPFNTYKYQGLPPAPICNPGLNAIQAAVYPTETDYNYFLTKPDTGEAVFSRTYSEHLKNKANYLKN